MFSVKKYLVEIVFVSLFVFYSLIIGLVTYFFYFRDLQNHKELFSSQQNQGLLRLKEQIEKTFTDVVVDIKILNSHVELSEYIRSGTEDSRINLEHEFLVLSVHKAQYDQVRLIDDKGDEKIRINWNDGAPAIVDQPQLQNKKGRYYFIDTMTLSQGEVYVSPFDLNIEGSQVELPYKPMIRISVPIFHQGEKKGILALNYLGQKIIDEIKTSDQAQGAEYYLVDRQGYWLKGPQKESEWAFMWEDKKNLTMANTDPELWQKLTSQEEGTFETKEGRYQFFTIRPFLLAQSSSLGSNRPNSPSLAKLSPEEYKWIVVSFQPFQSLYQITSQITALLLTISSGIWLIISVIWFSLYRLTKGRFETEEQMLRLNNVLRIINKTLRHDLANGFTAIANFIEMYKESPSQQIIIDAGKVVQRSLDLIRQMRELESSVNAGGTYHPISLRELLGNTFKDFNIIYQLLGDEIVKVDEGLKVVFKNLIDNAIRHGQSTKITVKIKKKGNKVRISFADNGKGVPDEIKPKIFDEGFTSGENSNTGLGLYIVKETIERYEGKIIVTDAHPQGANFVMEIPLR